MRSPDIQPNDRKSDFVFYDDQTASLMEAVHLKAAELRSQAMDDELTGLPNRRGFMRGVADQLQYFPERHLALGIIDLGNFKRVNDLHGHPVGDETLQHVTSRLRRTELFGILGRIGGDELGLLIDLDDVHEGATQLESYDARLQHVGERLHQEGKAMREADPRLAAAEFFIAFGAYLPTDEERHQSAPVRELIHHALEVADGRLYADKDAERIALGFQQYR